MKNRPRRRTRKPPQNKLLSLLLLSTLRPNATAAQSTSCASPQHNAVNLGYYESWAVYRSCSPVRPGDIDVEAFGYTHLAFSFAGISTGGELEQYNGSSEYDAMYKDFNALKERYGGLKTLIAVGGWSFNQLIFAEVASTEDKRAKFAKSVVSFLELHGFDGIDLDWEYPVTRQGTPQDYANYPLLCSAIRKAFDHSNHPDWLITVATSINPTNLKKGYDMLAMYPHIDFFNIMSYDIHGSWDETAGANTDMEYIRDAFDYIFGSGVPPEKLVLGLAAYGRSSALADPTCVADGCPVRGAGLYGCHGEGGNLPYFEIESLYAQPGGHDSKIFNPKTGSMEIVTGGGANFLSYDNAETFNIKYRYAFENCLRGIMWWAVDLITDPIPFYEYAPSESPSASFAPTTHTRTPTTSPSRHPTNSPTAVPPCGFTCPDGVARGEKVEALNCVGYFTCTNGKPSEWTLCENGLVFDAATQVCNWAWATDCRCKGPTAPSSQSAGNGPFEPVALDPEQCNTEARNTIHLGYWESWSMGRGSSCNGFPIDTVDVDAFGYTHLVFSFAGISWKGELEPYDGGSEYASQYAEFNSLKVKFPGLKTLIAVGGWTFQQARFCSVASTAAKREHFAKSVVKFLEDYDFDGIDIDWEYPVTRQGTMADYDNYPLLCEAIRKAFDDAGHSDWLITVATTINPSSLSKGYDMVAMYPHIDFFNIMAYDIHGSWDDVAGANADFEYIQNTMNYIYGLGIPREKLVLGLAGYGRSMALTDPDCYTDGCPVKGAGLWGCHGEGGSVPYLQIDEVYVQTGDYDSLLLNEKTASMELVTHNYTRFTSYDSPETIRIKFRYAFKECLRGVMWWAVDLIREPFVFWENAPSGSPSVSFAPTTETRTPTTRPTQAPTVTCGSGCPRGVVDFLPTIDCTGYYTCSNGSPGDVTLCDGGTLFDVELQMCNWPWSFTCRCFEVAPSPPTTSLPTTNKKVTLYSIPSSGLCAPVDEATPSWIETFYSDWATCCKAGWQYDACMRGALEEETGPTETLYYAIPSSGLCAVVDSSTPDWMTYADFFSDYVKCCKSSWNVAACIAEMPAFTAKPSATPTITSSTTTKNPYSSPPTTSAPTTSKPITSPPTPQPNTKKPSPPPTTETPITPSPSTPPPIIKKPITSPPTTSPPTKYPNQMEQQSSPVGANDYYPDYDRSTCLNDGKAPEFEVNFFSTYDACCYTYWMDTQKCLANKPLADKRWYPDYRVDHCKNDGNQPNSVLLSATYEDCCDRFFMSNTAGCYADSKSSLSLPATTNKPTQKPSPPPITKTPITASPTTPPPITKTDKQWYPDYRVDHCKNDGNTPNGVLLSATYEDCCNRFFMSNTAGCYADSKASLSLPATTNKPTQKPSPPPSTKTPITPLPTQYPTKDEMQQQSAGGGSQKWYPVSGGQCANDGNPPNNVALSDTAEGCCKRFYPHFQDCTSLSTGSKQNDEMEQQSYPVEGANYMYYPIYDRSACSNDGKAPEFVSFYETYEACCKLSWMELDACLANKPTWYPVSGGYCANDGSPPNNVAMSDTSDNCCKRYYPYSHPTCQYKSDNRWYPDYRVDHCKNDGKQPQGVLMSATYEGCCDRFFMTSKAGCYADSQASLDPQTTTNKPTAKPTTTPTTQSPSKQKDEMKQQSSPTGGTDENQYYPDYDHSTCLNDGMASEFEINFFSTYDACCKFSWMDTVTCLANKPSTESPKWYPVVGGYCTNGGNPPNNIAPSDTAEECCKRFYPYSQDCPSQTANPTKQPTSRPSLRTTNQSIITVQSSYCQGLKKKKCRQDVSCTWDDTTSVCSHSGSNPVDQISPNNE